MVNSTDTKRFELHQTLREELGADAADTLMEYLPPTGWSDVARKQDIDNLRLHTDGQFEHGRDQWTSEAALLRQDINTLRNDMNNEFNLVRAEWKAEAALIRQEMATMKAEIIGIIDAAMSRQTRWIISLMSAQLLTMTALVGTVITKL